MCRHAQGFLGNGREGVSFPRGVGWLLGGTLWKLNTSPGEGLAQAQGQKPQGVWLVRNSQTSRRLDGGVQRKEVRALPEQHLEAQRAWLSHSALLMGNGAPLTAFKEEGTGWKILCPGLSGQAQMGRFYQLGSPTDADHGGSMDQSVLPLRLSLRHEQ